MRSSVTTAVDGCTYSPTTTRALADVAGKRRDDDDVGDRLLGERELRARLRRARRARRATLLAEVSACVRAWSAMVCGIRPPVAAAPRCAARSSAPACSAIRPASGWLRRAATAARASSSRRLASTPWMRTSTAPLATCCPTSTGVAITRPELSGATSDDSSAWKLPVASTITGSSTPLTGATATAAGGRARRGGAAVSVRLQPARQYEGKACDAGGERRGTNAHQ